MTDLLHPDPFLSQYLKRPAYTLCTKDMAPPPLTRAVKRLCTEDAFAQAKTGAEDLALAGTLQQAGFRLADTNLTLERPQGGLPFAQDELRCRAARPEDAAEVCHIAGTSFRFSRLHMDPLISDQAADAFKSAWAGNYFSGKRGDAMIVAEAEGRIVGFLQLLRKEDTLVVDLIAVDHAHRGKRTASGMIAHADRSLKGFSRWRTGTQAANIPSLRLYESLGFRMAGAHYLFHFHGDTA